MIHGNTAYFSRGNRVYSYTLSSDEWTTLKLCELEHFGLAVVNNRVTTIGGLSGKITATNTLFCLEETKWRELLPPMPTARLRPATVTTPTCTHLIVAGGRTGLLHNGLSTIEILDTKTHQWSSASSSPQAMDYPQMSLCAEHLYLSEHNTIFSCSVEELLKFCKTNSSDGSSVWTKLANIPVQHRASLTTLTGQVLAIGGKDRLGSGTPTGAIHRCDRHTNSWSVIGEMPTPRYHPLVAVLPSNELIVVGGMDARGRSSNINEIAHTD